MKRFFAAAALFLASFAPMAMAPQAAEASYALKASGPWRSNDGLWSGTWSATFDVAGYDLSGTVNFIGLPGIAEGNMQGTWDLSSLGFGVMFLDQELATFTGGLQGDQFVGDFDAGDIVGTWSGKLSQLEVVTDPIDPIVSNVLPTLLLSRASGKLGDIVSVVATLSTLGNSIGKLENIINFDSLATPILANASGKPDCSVNPAIGKLDTIFEFLPKGCSGTACTQVRAVVQSLTSVAAIADGAQLYSCKVKIARDATTGIYQLVASSLKAFDVRSLPIKLTSLSGQISALKSRLGFLGDCHCSTVQDSGRLPLLGILAPLALLVVRRRKL